MSQLTITLNSREVCDLCLALRLRAEACEENAADEHAEAKRWRALMRKIDDAELEPEPPHAAT